MEVKIISNGTVVGTRVENAETGELIDDVTAVVFSADVSNRHDLVTLHLELYAKNVEIEGKVTSTCYECGDSKLTIYDDGTHELNTPQDNFTFQKAAS